MASGVFPREGDTERRRAWSGWNSRVGGSRTSPWAFGGVEQWNRGLIRRRLESARRIAKGLSSAGQFYRYIRVCGISGNNCRVYDAQCALLVGGPAPEFVTVHQLDTLERLQPPTLRIVPQTSQTPVSGRQAPSTLVQFGASALFHCKVPTSVFLAGSCFRALSPIQHSNSMLGNQGKRERCKEITNLLRPSHFKSARSSF